MSKNTIEVDTKTFVRFWLVIAALALIGLFVWKAAVGLIIVGISIFLAIAIRPLSGKFEKLLGKKKEHKKMSAVLAFLAVVIVAVGSVAVIGPVVFEQSSKFVGQLPDMFENTLGGWDGINDFGKTLGISDLQGQVMNSVENFSANILNDFGSNVVEGIGAVGSGLATAVIILVLTLLFLLEGPEMLKKFWDTLEGKERDEAVEEARRVVSRMGNVVATYVSRQVIVAILDGTATAIAVAILAWIFHFPLGLAFPMGLIAAIFCLIPMFGQVIGCVLVSLVILFNSPLAGVIFAAFYIVYSQVENNAIAPKLQGDALKLPAVVILSAITIGTYMFGLIGAIISIPIAGCIKVFVEEYPRMKELNQK